MTEVEEALLRRSHLPTTRHGSARHGCAGLPHTCRELRCCPAPPPPPPPPATDACCNSAREGNDRRRAGSHAPVPPATRAAHAEALVCWAAGGAALMLTMATSAVRDTVTRCTPGTVVGGVNAVVRLPGTSVGERQHTSLSYTRQGGRGAGAAAHPTMVRTESMAICENGQGGSGQARRRGVARRGDRRAQRGGAHRGHSQQRTSLIIRPEIAEEVCRRRKKGTTHLLGSRSWTGTQTWQSILFVQTAYRV